MTPTDVLLVGLGSTAGLRAAEDGLAGSLRRAGASVELVRPGAQRDVRTLMWTDWVWAHAAREVALEALERYEPRAIVYSTVTAALRWPCPGAIRFDAPAAGNRRGRHGLWQRPLERRRLAQAPLLIPQSEGAMEEAGRPQTPSVIVPIPVEPSGEPGERDVAAVTYQADPVKKGRREVEQAWALARRDGEELEVCERMAPEDFRALLRRARVYVTAPRREDYGLAQLEALADGCQVVTVESPGPYAALPILRALDRRLVVGLGELTGSGFAEPLAEAIRTALDDPVAGYAERALELLEPFRRASVDRTVADELLARLLP